MVLGFADGPAFTVSLSKFLYRPSLASGLISALGSNPRADLVRGLQRRGVCQHGRGCEFDRPLVTPLPRFRQPEQEHDHDQADDS